MATQVEMIAANQQRQQIPGDWLLVFNDWSNNSLLSLSQDVLAPSKVRAWAGWEFDYRAAFGIEVVENVPLKAHNDGRILDEIVSKRVTHQP